MYAFMQSLVCVCLFVCPNVLNHVLNHANQQDQTWHEGTN